jgi:beta-lactamase class D
MRGRLLVLLGVLGSLSFGGARAEDERIAKIFARHGVQGTLVIAGAAEGRTIVHNDARAIVRFTPASTFKVFNTLIALQEQVVEGPHSVLRWDGTRHDFPDWNRDQTLESAFRVSCVWCYQDFASRIGAEAYRNHLRGADYGVLREPFEVTTFWLDGALRVSALDQIELLRRIHRRVLPFDAASYDTLAALMVVERTSRFVLRAKTGWGARAQPQIGWYVGWLETQGATIFFALNMTVKGEADLPLRQQIVREALAAHGLMP